MRELIYMLATWRLSYMLVSEDGPFEAARKLREATGVEYDANGPATWPDWNPLTCVYCTSVWVATALLFCPGWIHRLFAASAVAVMIEKLHESRRT